MFGALWLSLGGMRRHLKRRAAAVDAIERSVSSIGLPGAGPRLERRLQILMLERRRHAIDLRPRKIEARCLPRHVATALPTSAAIARAVLTSSSKYPATSIARSSDAVPSSRSIAVVRTRGLMSVGTGLRS